MSLLSRDASKRRIRVSFRLSFLVSVISLSTCISASAAQREEIFIKSSLVKKTLILVDAEVLGKPVQLECFTSDSDCKVPKNGHYFFVRLPAGKGKYMNCPNIILHEGSTSSHPGAEIGEFCFLVE